MKKLYVGNLAYSTTNEDLTNLFSKFGNIVSANIIKDKSSGTSKGFGFIEMSGEEEAATAIRELNGTSLGGRNLKVNEAMESDSRPRRSNNNNNERFSERY